jgi:effector protein B
LHFTIESAKAIKLKKRKEEKAYTAAWTLAKALRSSLEQYASDGEFDERIALDAFKKSALNSIDQSKKILHQHREEWKYILANVTLAVLLVGLGYVAAGLINKKSTGSFTFFSKTDSANKLEELEDQVHHLSV